MSVTQTQFQDMIERQLTPFRQDLSGTNSIAITGGTETLWANNGLGHENTSAPAYMTDRWDAVNNTMMALTEYDHPTYVVDMGFLFTSDTPNTTGVAVIRIYIDESGTQDFGADPVIRTYRTDYVTGSAPNTAQMSVLGTWYWGEELGFDAKMNGVYFTVTFEDSGDITGPTTVIYNTQ